MTDTLVAPRGSVGARRALLDALPLLLGLVLLAAGNGLTSTLVGVRAGVEGLSTPVTGVVMSGYYVGFLLGTLVTPSRIAHVGHIRVFAGLASLASAAVLLHIVRPDPVTWFALRALAGVCVSGLYVVTETWLNGAATNSTRGSLLAAYMVAVTGGLGLGQLLLPVADVAGFASFVMASVLVSLAVVPVALTRVRAPELPDPTPLSLSELVRCSPPAVVVAALSGTIAAAVIGAGPVYARASGLGPASTSALLVAALGGALVLQIPLGRWSDRGDRRVVVGAVSALGAVASVGAVVAGPQNLVALLPLMALAGGAAFPLYALASALLNDNLDETAMVAGGARLVLVNGAGAVAGPILATIALDRLGPAGFFWMLAAGHAGACGYAAYRIRRRAAAPEATRSEFVPIPAGAGVTVTALQDGSGAGYFPLTQLVVPTERALIAVAEQGAGPAVLLLHGGSSSVTSWDEVRPLLAGLGFRAIVPSQRGAVESPNDHVDDLVAIMHHLDLPSAVIVGLGDGADIGIRFAERYAERVEALVLVGAAWVAAPAGLTAVRSDLDPTVDAEDLADAIAELLRHR